MVGRRQALFLRRDAEGADDLVQDTLERAIADGLDAITAEDAHGWFYGCGYIPLRQQL